MKLLDDATRLKDKRALDNHLDILELSRANQHRIAVDTELGPQATSILSPEFAIRLAAAQKR
jgi:hypothetical protein